MVVYLDCFNDTFCQIPAAAWWLTGDFSVTTSDGNTLNGELLNKHQTCTNNQLKVKRISFFFPTFVSEYYFNIFILIHNTFNINVKSFAESLGSEFPVIVK